MGPVASNRKCFLHLAKTYFFSFSLHSNIEPGIRVLLGEIGNVLFYIFLWIIRQYTLVEGGTLLLYVYLYYVFIRCTTIYTACHAGVLLDKEQHNESRKQVWSINCDPVVDQWSRSCSFKVENYSSLSRTCRPNSSRVCSNVKNLVIEMDNKEFGFSRRRHFSTAVNLSSITNLSLGIKGDLNHNGYERYDHLSTTARAQTISLCPS